ncbi:unnamed protein product [Mytilus coruscus]|uniref:C-type lectin domain-containing protein n=1 Tax=Mytilus coruscus TaxID=42192 RepID=A0A6J8F257_MYTCO|nr:unnamed protein product [Mytilus coruscus]
MVENIVLVFIICSFLNGLNSGGMFIVLHHVKCIQLIHASSSDNKESLHIIERYCLPYNIGKLNICIVDDLTWIESASRCTLANQQEIQTVNDSYPVSWIGGYYLTSPWVAYLGCFYNVTSLYDDSDRYLKNSPAACLSQCGAFYYFTLEFEHCRCLTSKSNLHTTDPEYCKSGKRHKYFHIYKTIKLTKEFRVFDDNHYTYAVEQKKCNVFDYYSVKDRPNLHNIMFEGKSYWTNVLRLSTERWVDNTTDIDDLKDITKNRRYQRCLSASQSVGYLPAVRQLPCNNIVPFRCSRAYTPALPDAALKTGSYLEYIVSTSVAFGIIIFTILAIWMCRKVKKTIKSKSHIPSPRIIVSQNQISANGHDCVEYDELNPAEMIDMTSAKPMEIKEENIDPETNWNYSSYINQFDEHECSIQVLLSHDTE